MQQRSHTFILLCCLLFAAPTQHAWACGSGSTGKCGKAISKKSCCKDSNQRQASCCSSSQSSKTDQHNETCPHKKGGDGCHCPCGTAASSHSGGLLPEIPPTLSPFSDAHSALLRQAFYYALHMPEAVYLPIWQPPKLDV